MNPTMDVRGHLDAGTLAAFAEGSLHKGQRAVVFSHLAACQVCRDWLAANARLKNFQWDGFKLPTVRTARLAAGSFWIKGAAAVACALVIFLLLVPQLKSPYTSTATTNGNCEVENRCLAAFPHPNYFPHVSLAARRTKFPGPWSRARLVRDLNFEATLMQQVNASGRSEDSEPSLNQIAVTTNLGERWITLNAFDVAAQGVFLQ
jgi:hypothetical protein